MVKDCLEQIASVPPIPKLSPTRCGPWVHGVVHLELAGYFPDRAVADAHFLAAGRAMFVGLQTGAAEGSS